MGLIVTTDGKPVTVYVNEKQAQSGNAFKTYSISVASKDRDGNWVNGYLDCQFKKADAERISNKCKIEISKSFYTVNEYNGKKYLKLFVLDFNVVEDGQTSQNNGGWMDVPDFGADELPFE